MSEEIFLNAVSHSHDESMEHALNVLGYENVRGCVPFTLDEIKEALRQGDTYLNTLPMKVWDYAAGFVFGHNRKTETEEIVLRPDTPLTKLYRKAGLTAWSCSEGVSLLKHTARKWAEESALSEVNNPDLRLTP